MEDHGSVTRLIHDLRSETPAVRELAARMVWERYFRDLLQLARKSIDRRIRRREDEEDVLQSMYKSFCIRLRRGEFELLDRDALWGLLVTITLCKARNLGHKYHRAKRNVDLEQAQPVVSDNADWPQWALDEMDASGPTPAEAAVLSEALEHRLQTLVDPMLRQVALLKLEGCTNREIARRNSCTERTVERKLERIRAKWLAHENPGTDP
jgi:DNA-directed RNA polymerase specialized sigma24 family protein